MKFKLEALASCALLFPVGEATLLRARSIAGASESWALGTNLDKVEQLLTDIDQSLSKANTEIDDDFASIYNFDSHLQRSLERELASVQKDLERLQHKAPEAPRQLAASRRSHEDVAAESFFRILSHFMAKGSMKGAPLTKQQQADGPHKAIADSMGFLRALLLRNVDLRPKFVDVYVAVLPNSATSLVQTEAAKRDQQLRHSDKKVHLSKAVRAHALELLKILQERTAKNSKENDHGSEDESLVQTDSSSTRVETSAEARATSLAERDQELQERNFSSRFAQAVIQLDKTFHNEVHENVVKKAQIVEAIHQSTKEQHRLLKSLSNLLQGRYDEDVPATRGDANAAPSFLQFSSGLQQRITDAVQNKVDKHNVLLQIQALLDKETHAKGNLNTLSDLRSVIASLQEEQGRSADSRKQCEEQSQSSHREESTLRNALALLIHAQAKTKASAVLASANAKATSQRLDTLGKAAQDIAEVVRASTASLQEHGRDRHTIVAALRKARRVLADGTSIGLAGDSLFASLLEELDKQQKLEHDFLEAEASLRSGFSSYAAHYTELLTEQRSFFERAAKSLESYLSEVHSEKSTEEESLAAAKSLAQEGAEACEGLLNAQNEEHARRDSLLKTLQKVEEDLSKVAK
mmetsp:Transcript_97948/g.204313  ORF Transcript_97948/g.204313 Transcript_97948/m.204313 type:complete len:638 (+) Transcript_97948:125-2038(+)